MDIKELLRARGLPEGIKGTCGIEFMESGKVAYIADPSYVKYVKPDSGVFILVTRAIYNAVKGIRGNFYIICDNPVWTFTEIHNALHDVVYFRESDEPKAGNNSNISRTARFGSDVVIGGGVTISDYVVVGSRVEIGGGSVIMPHTVIFDDVKIGSGCTIGSRVSLGGQGFRPIRRNEKLTGSSELMLLTHLGGLRIGNNVRIGDGSCIDRATFKDTLVKDFADIGSLCYIAHNVEICENAVLGDRVCVAGSTRIGRNSRVGRSAVIRDQIKIGDNVRVDDNAVVVGDAGDGKQLSGFYAVDRDCWEIYAGKTMTSHKKVRH